MLLLQLNMEATTSTLALRYKAVVTYERLKSWKGSANEIGKSVRYVKTWVGRHRTGMSLADKKRAGRPTLGLDTDEAMSVIERCITEELAPAQMALRLKSRLGKMLGHFLPNMFVLIYMIYAISGPQSST